MGERKAVFMTRETMDSRAREAVKALGTTYRPGTPIEDVKRQYQLSSVIKLASNENPLGPSPKAVEEYSGGVFRGQDT